MHNSFTDNNTNQSLQNFYNNFLSNQNTINNLFDLEDGDEAHRPGG